MKIRIFCFSLILLWPFSAFPDQDELALDNYFYKHLAGKINNSGIIMNLNRAENTLYGNYYYQRIGSYIALNGEIDNSGNIILKEYDKGKQTGIFKGRFINQNEIYGKWQNTAGTKEFPFLLNEDYSSGGITFQGYHISDTVSLFQGQSGPEANFILHYLHPCAFENQDSLICMQKKFQTLFFGKILSEKDPQKGLLEKKQSLLDEIREIESYNDSDYAINYDQCLEMAVIFNENFILTISLDSYAYTGGAHGIASSEFFVYDLHTCSQSKLEHIFKPGFEQELSRLIEQKIKQQNDITVDASLMDYGFFVETITPSMNFYVNKEGMGFFYNVYEIAPYTFGPVNIFIAFKEISYMFKENNPIEELYSGK